MKFDTINGQSGSSVVSPSSDSGVHSLDEQWECMSTYSGESDSCVAREYRFIGLKVDRKVLPSNRIRRFGRG